MELNADPGGGVRMRPAEMALVRRARDYLTRGPADPVELIAYVCQLPNPPRFVAEHMAVALLSALGEFDRDAAGRWRITPPTAIRAVRERPPCGTDQLQELSYVVVDVETTGGRAYGGDRITEVAAVSVRGGAVVDVYETLVNPERPIPPMITSLTNITYAMVKDAPRFSEIVPRLETAMRGHVFVAHNAGFDWRFLAAEIGRATGARIEGRKLCTVRVARQLLHLSRRSLDHVARHYSVEITNRHRAGGDAVATARVWVKMLRDLRARGVMTWSDLEKLVAPIPVGRRRRRRRSAMPRSIDRDTTA
jgi:DNA polymerase-3 subunit epsilon